MDTELHTRIENLERLCEQTLKAITGLHQEFTEFREAQRKETAKTQALLRQFGARIGTVESRVGAVEERLQAVETMVFSAAA